MKGYLPSSRPPVIPKGAARVLELLSDAEIAARAQRRKAWGKGGPAEKP